MDRDDYDPLDDEGEEMKDADDDYDSWRDSCFEEVCSSMNALSGSVEEATEYINRMAKKENSYYRHRHKELWTLLYDIAFAKCFVEKDVAWLDLLEACSKNEFLEVL